MAKPKLGTKTPDSTDSNALIEAHEDLLADPKARRYAIVEIAVPEILQHVGGDSQAKVVLTHIELVEGRAEDDAVAILDRSYRARTGNKARPGPDEEDTPLDLSGLRLVESPDGDSVE